MAKTARKQFTLSAYSVRLPPNFIPKELPEAEGEHSMANDKLPPFLQALLRPERYDHPAPDLKLVQTHISSVILAGDFVYKFKKPVNFGFLDFSDLEKRHTYCEQELLLNRRLCPDIYLGLVEVTAEPDGGYVLNGKGVVVEYGVKMARMPEERMMPHLIRSGEMSAAHVDALVNVLAGFYQRADGGAEITRFGTASAVGVNVLENFDQTRGSIGQGALSQEQFDCISSSARAFLGREALFQQRIDGGYIRDCHGDLYSANICLADKVYIYDCIEFNQRFRYCDVASDVAFLAMDLDFYGLDHLARRFIDHFVQATADPGLMEMLDFYKCYRAYVRGKISLFTAADPAVDSAVKTASIENAARYFRLAQRYAVI
jgi:aminoglycoside phosphotransferase family enzyme